jgi:hypothetical protein
MKRIAAVTSFFVFSFLGFLRVVNDYDTWWHIAVGKYIWLTRTVPLKDIFSFSLPNYPYVYHTWLTELILFLAYKSAGMWGISIFYAAVCAAGYTFIAIGLSEKLKPLPVAIGLFFSLPVFTYTIQARSQTVTFMLLCLVSLILTEINYHPEKIKIMYILPVITLFWANLHGGFMQGLLVIGLSTAGQLANRDFNFRKSLPLLTPVCLSFLTTFVNP